MLTRYSFRLKNSMTIQISLLRLFCACIHLINTSVIN